MFERSMSSLYSNKETIWKRQLICINFCRLDEQLGMKQKQQVRSFVGSTVICFRRATAEKKRPKLYRRSNTKLLKNVGDNYDDTTLHRVDRVLSNRSGKSRSDCFKLLQQKRVQYMSDAVDMEWRTVSGPSIKVPMYAPLRIDKTTIVPLPPPLLCVYNKPKWVLSVVDDPIYNRPCIKPPPGMHPVGRLDYDSSGLILFSSSGALTQSILHPKYSIEKTYVATVAGTVDEENLRNRLTVGVTTGEGIHTAKIIAISHFPSVDSVRTYIDRVMSNIPSHYNKTDLKERGYFDDFETTTLSTVTLTVSEGKHRMVRRMLANCGYPVVDLYRTQIGPEITINEKELPPGTMRELTPNELKWAKEVLVAVPNKANQLVAANSSTSLSRKNNDTTLIAKSTQQSQKKKKLTGLLKTTDKVNKGNNGNSTNVKLESNRYIV